MDSGFDLLPKWKHNILSSVPWGIHSCLSQWRWEVLAPLSFEMLHILQTKVYWKESSPLVPAGDLTSQMRRLTKKTFWSHIRDATYSAWDIYPSILLWCSFISPKTLNLAVKLCIHGFRDWSPIVFAQQHYLKSQRHCQVLASVCMSCPFWLFKEMHFKTAWEDEEPLIFSIHLSVILLCTLSQLLNLRSNPHRGERKAEESGLVAH